MFILLMVLMVLVSGCGMENISKADNVLENDTEANEGDISRKEDVEEDVNAIDIEEDEDLTEKAKEENVTEEDVLIPQEEVEEKSQENIPLENEEEEKEEEYVVVSTFDTALPLEITSDIRYNKYPISYNYLLVLGKHINIREKPTTQSKILRKASIYEKINLVEAVKGQNIEKYNRDLWYKVFWKDGEEIAYGYVFHTLGEAREFQFVKMWEGLNVLKNEVEKNTAAYIANYKNRNGRAPLYKGKTKDIYGERSYQSAPAYIQPNTQAEFRYIADGTLVTVLEEDSTFYKIKTLNFEGEYWVPKKYVSFRNSIEELKKVVVVDRKNQNEGVFEFVDGKWHLISYSFSTTGENARYKMETPLGYYMAIETKPRFLYLDDVTKEIDGYAPYAIRFTGGAYIHGVPVNFKMVDGKRVDPGMKEYLFTIGTTPRSHKCVRNYTSHAKFLYDWIEIGKSAVIVIE